MKAKSFFVVLIFPIIFIQSEMFSQAGWQQQTSSTSQILNSISIIDENTAYVCGGGGTIIKTTDGGTNWILQNSGYTNELTDIYFINSLTGWACGGISNYPNIGTFSVLNTINGGNNWNVIYNVYSIPGYYISSFNSVHFINSQTGFVSVSRTNGIYALGHVLYTTNGGINWQSNGPNLSNGYITFINQNTGYLLSGYWDDTGKDTCYFYKSTDTGLSWILISKYSGFVFKKPSFINLNTGWIAGTRKNSGASFDGVVYRTNNGGVNWNYTTMVSNSAINSVSFLSQDLGYACGMTIYRTDNGGINWVQQQTPALTLKSDIKFITNNTGWCVGSSGVILKTTTGGFLGITKISFNVPGKIFLSQNYPNPFNPITTIQFSIPKSLQQVQIFIYDVLGNKIFELVNEKLEAGLYETQWDASNYASGVYYYTLISGDYKETKKMILVK
jgi:photosystem II stability/assembly factor-like uncharacterized protein